MYMLDAVINLQFYNNFFYKMFDCSKLCSLLMYSKTCLKRPLKNRQNKGLENKW